MDMVFVFMQDQLKSSEDELARLQGQMQFLTRVRDCGPFSVWVTPQAPKVDGNKSMLIFDATECSACGMGFANDVMVGVCMLACRHPYHLYCFGMLCWMGDQCIDPGCNEHIPAAVKKNFGCNSMSLPTSTLKTPKSKLHVTCCFFEFIVQCKILATFIGPCASRY